MESIKIPVSVRCERCNQEMYYLSDDLEGNDFLVCGECGFETSCVWCPKCGMGGEFVKDIARHPNQWTCPDCKSQYSLGVDFYRSPIKLMRKEQVPPEYWENPKGDSPSPLKMFLGFLFAIGLLVAFLAMKALINNLGNK